jgi:tryptophan synthase alpha chain
MDRIAQTFAEIRAGSTRGFIPFVTAGDPDLDTSLSIINMLADEGAAVIELGVPFSDPMADGPTIQASSQRALLNGVKLADVLELVRQFRRRFETPIVLFGYLNPIIQYGYDRFCNNAAAAGVDGVLITDVDEHETAHLRAILASKGMHLISLVAPTTSDERLEKIVSRSTGFIYAVSRAGVTGARNEMSDAAEKLVTRVWEFTDLPIAVGFGISNQTQVEATWKFADAAVVGSAIVSEIARCGSSDDVVEHVRMFVRGILPEVANTRAEI